MNHNHPNLGGFLFWNGHIPKLNTLSREGNALVKLGNYRN